MPFPKHLRLSLRREHFTQWLHLFNLTVDTHFSGPKANQAKIKAQHIAQVFQIRLGLQPAVINAIN